MNSNKMKNNVISNPLFIIIMLLLGLIIVLSVFRTASPFLTLGFGINARIGDLKGSFEIEAFDNNTEAVFIMYYAEWCGHCKRTMPEFNSLMETYNGNVKIQMIDSEAAENAELVKSQNIRGFPTIRYYPSGLSSDYQEYDGERTAAQFVQYLNSL